MSIFMFDRNVAKSVARNEQSKTVAAGMLAQAGMYALTAASVGVYLPFAA
jgi:hypothetical protein